MLPFVRGGLRHFRVIEVQARIVTRHCRPSCSVGMGAYSIDVMAPVHTLRSSAASIPVMVIGTLDRNDFGASIGLVAFDVKRLDHEVIPRCAIAVPLSRYFGPPKAEIAPGVILLTARSRWSTPPFKRKRAARSLTELARAWTFPRNAALMPHPTDQRNGQTPAEREIQPAPITGALSSGRCGWRAAA